MRVVNTREMKEIEKTAEKEYGLEESLIIENFGIRGANYLYNNFLENKDFGEIILFVGKGNNGADGLAVGRHLREYGIKVRAFMLWPKSDCSEELLRQAKLAHSMGVKISEVSSANEISTYFMETQKKYFVIDAIFGTGVRLPLSNFMSEVVSSINEYSNLIAAIDIPSGVIGDTGQSDSRAIHADITLAVGIPKTGYYSTNGAKHSGDVKVIKGGFPKDLIRSGSKNLITLKMISKILGKRNKFAHKNSFGHCLVVGGNYGQTGALVLAANGALKTGAGLVTAVTWEDCYQELSGKLNPEIMSRFVPRDKEKMAKLVEQTDLFDSIVIGPGLGRGEYSRELVIQILSSFRGPVVLDADAINALDMQKDKEIFQGRTFPTILTPHLGEFSELVGKPVDKIEDAPIDNLREVLDVLRCYVLIKGPGTYIGMPTGEIYINYMPNAGMATGGSGDVLAGILGGMCAQSITGNQNFNKDFMENEMDAVSCLGVFIHSLSGKYAAEKFGPRAMTAWSIINNLPSAFQNIQNVQEGK